MSSIRNAILNKFGTLQADATQRMSPLLPGHDESIWDGCTTLSSTLKFALRSLGQNAARSSAGGRGGEVHRPLGLLSRGVDRDQSGCSSWRPAVGLS